MKITESARVGIDFNPNQKFYFTENTIGIGTPPHLLPNNLQIVGVKPHGKNCGCKTTNKYGAGLGCPNPTIKLNIK